MAKVGFKSSIMAGGWRQAPDVRSENGRGIRRGGRSRAASPGAAGRACGVWRPAPAEAKAELAGGLGLPAAGLGQGLRHTVRETRVPRVPHAEGRLCLWCRTERASSAPMGQP